MKIGLVITNSKWQKKQQEDYMDSSSSGTHGEYIYIIIITEKQTNAFLMEK